MEGYWDVVVSSIQDTCNSNQRLSFNKLDSPTINNKDDEEEINTHVELIKKHKENLEKTKRILDTALINVNGLLSQPSSNNNNDNQSVKLSDYDDNEEDDDIEITKTTSSLPTPRIVIRGSKTTPITGNSSISGKNISGKTLPGSLSDSSTSSTTRSSNYKSNSKGKSSGRSFYTSPYHPSSPITVGSEVAYKNKRTTEWIQCSVIKVISDTKFEVLDPEPDDGVGVFIANYKEVLLIPAETKNLKLRNYPIGYKVLAKYPETTAFYPAEVTSTVKKSCRLKFEGEEEVGKETEIERRFVLPYPK